ncbi:glutamate--tRNA ligase [Ammoniphilus resinae]|uniref:Glutamate--tRNA ligase n=1 Tax=Ammoniphilus resinae TaxID=861532 RepID=A0ABS4GR62_9BACL|nr:glutamate--tRNA ligase [Ammoniphilus resinae]MBP1932512.1 nondiscriminating glutamyl-tRNA synthetase [Ammoniphilus resinae]
MSKEVRVRFAPSPTGHLHIGGARSALFNYLFARHQGGKFVIRIEDTDQQRNVENAEAKLIDSMRWLGVDWDESIDVGGPYAPYRSMDRMDIYTNHLQQLIDEGKAYYCYCTPEELEKDREEQKAKGETPQYAGRCRHLTLDQRQKLEQEGRKPSIRFLVPKDREYVVSDHVRGQVTFESNGIGDFVIARPDGIPTYNFAVTVDDSLMKISHVIRGEEHLSNTPRQLMVYEAFGYETPEFAHVALILNKDRQKMSKRDESVVQFVEQYRDLGYLPEALLNFLVLLGWSPEGEEEIFTREQLIEQFSLERVSKSPAVFDQEKLKWMNNHYIKQQPVERVVELCKPHLLAAGWINEQSDEEWIKRLVALYQEQLHFGAEIVELASLFFQDEIEYGEEAKTVLSEDQVPTVLKAFYAELQALESFTDEDIKQALKAVQKGTGFKGKALFMPVRAAVTGELHGRDLNHTISLLGKEKVSGRLLGFIQ